MKACLGPIVSGEYISSPMINFLSSCITEQQANLVNSIFRGKGIVSAYDGNGMYDNSLRVSAGANNNIVINEGVFVSPHGKLIQVPYTETNINANQLNKIFIRYAQSIYVPNTTISGSGGSFSISYNNEEILELIQAGMGLITESMFRAGTLTPMKVVTVGTTLTIENALSADINNERFIVVPKFITGVSDADSTCVYRFDTYEVTDEASLGDNEALASDWILLAVVTYNNNQYQIENVRVSSLADVPEADIPVSEYLPNVTSISTTYSAYIETLIKNFFTTGELTINEEEKNLFELSHQQNTDTGTSSKYFDISTSNGIFRIGDAVQRDYLVRLFADVAYQRSYKLPTSVPYGANVEEEIVLTIPALENANYFKGTIATKPVDTRLQDGTVQLTSESNVFNVANGGSLKRIQFSGEASDFAGQFVVLKFASRTAILSGGNIISNYLTNNESDEDTYWIDANEAAVFVNIGYSYLLVASGMADYSRHVSLRNALKDCVSTVTANKEEFDRFVEQTNSSLNTLSDSITATTQTLTESIASLNAARTQIEINSQDIIELKARATSLEAKATELDMRVGNLEARLDAISFIPDKTIIAVALTDAEISDHFDSTGVAKKSSKYKGYALCNGNNGTPNLAGRMLIMANQWTTGMPSSWNSSSITGYGTGTSQQGAYHEGAYNPTLSLATSINSNSRFIGEFHRKITSENLPAHTHYYFGDDNFKGSMAWVDAGYDAKSQEGGYNSGWYYARNTDKSGKSIYPNNAFSEMPPAYIVVYLMKLPN